MQIDNQVTWVAKYKKTGSRKGLPSNVHLPRVRTGLIQDMRVHDDGKREYLVRLLWLSGPLDHELTECIWVPHDDLVKWPAIKSQHYQPKSPFELLREQTAARQKRERRKKREIRRIMSDLD